jgi:hypothetical protein
MTNHLVRGHLAPQPPAVRPNISNPAHNFFFVLGVPQIFHRAKFYIITTNLTAKAANAKFRASQGLPSLADFFRSSSPANGDRLATNSPFLAFSRY